MFWRGTRSFDSSGMEVTTLGSSKQFSSAGGVGGAVSSRTGVELAARSVSRWGRVDGEG